MVMTVPNRANARIQARGSAKYALFTPGPGGEGMVIEPPVAADGLGPFQFTRDLAITPIDVNSDFSGGTVTSFSLHVSSDPLPTGLTLDADTGEIDGTPTVTAATVTIVVTGSNVGGSDQSSFDIEIVDPADPGDALLIAAGGDNILISAGGDRILIAAA